MLNRLSIKCSTCGETQLTRENFEHHINTTCPNTMISCSASDIKCTWIGLRHQLEQHLLSCNYEPLRAVLSELIHQNKEYKKENEHIHFQYKNISIKKQQVDDENEQFNIENKKLNLENTKVHVENKKLNLDNQKLNIEKERTHFQNQQLENEIQQLSHETQKLRIQAEGNVNENRELTKKISRHNNTQLFPEKLIEDNTSVMIDFSRKNLTTCDLTNVAQQLMVQKYTIIDLQDNVLTSQGIIMLIDALFNNWITLKYLCLSNNCISDLGVVILAGTFLLNNLTLKQLHLGSNCITDYGIKHLVGVLKTTKTLTDLLLSDNEITDEDVKYFN